MVSKEIYARLDDLIWHRIYRWCKFRHSNKTSSWIRKKYYQTLENRNGVFSDGIFVLANHTEIPIIRHIKVAGIASPFNGDNIYWASRLGKHPELPTRVTILLKRQKGKCNHCGLTFKDGEQIEVDHIIPKTKGGTDFYNNLQLLHRHCHDVKTVNDGSGRTHEKGHKVEERSEAKVSRSVLKTSGSRERIA